MAPTHMRRHYEIDEAGEKPLPVAIVVGAHPALLIASQFRTGATRGDSDVRGMIGALEIYEVDRLDFAEAYLVASAEATGIETIASFDRAIDKVATVRRLEPA